jgi:pimeloyl-ACP methyl ester carboxylesterase
MNGAKKSITVVLVHAAWADASSWNKVIPRLQKRGLQVVSAQIPLTSLLDDVDAVRRELARLQDPVVLAGHSYGGAVVSAAAAGEEKVEALAIIAGMAPEEGETVAALLHRDPPHPQIAQPVPDERGFLRLPEGAFANAVAPDSSAEECALMQVVQRPLSVKCITEPMPKPGWKEKQSWFLIAERDRMISPVTQRFMAERMKARIDAQDVDHTPLSSAPEKVVRLIVEAVDSGVFDARLAAPLLIGSTA